MKFFRFIPGLALLPIFSASAQVTVSLKLEQDQFLPGEALVVAVRVTNRSGQPLHFGADTDWLAFSVEGAEGSVVSRNSAPPVQGEFDLDSSQVGTKRVDLAPYFGLSPAGADVASIAQQQTLIQTIMVAIIGPATARHPCTVSTVSKNGGLSSWRSLL